MMSLENFIYSIVSGVFGILCAIAISMIKNRKKIDEDKIQQGVQKIAEELNIESINLFLVDDRKGKKKNKKIKFRFQSKGADSFSTNKDVAYQVVGSSGAVAVIVVSRIHPNLEEKLKDLSFCF